ncbi:MAG: DUF2716 domain-containing protein [Chitinophagales bacterium]
MQNFKLLNQDEHNMVWDRFYDLFDFKPSIEIFPAINTDQPQLKLDISNCFSINYPYHELETWALKLFKAISKPNERYYALDWQHPCYDFDPRQSMDRDDNGEWIVPVLPNGDYYIFLTKDFKNVWFGHPWEKTITLIGEDIVKYDQQMQSDFEKLKL